MRYTASRRAQSQQVGNEMDELDWWGLTSDRNVAGLVHRAGGNRIRASQERPMF